MSATSKYLAAQLFQLGSTQCQLNIKQLHTHSQLSTTSAADLPQLWQCKILQSSPLLLFALPHRKVPGIRLYQSPTGHLRLCKR